MRTKLVELRKRKGYTQEDVAKNINKSRSTYAMYETGAVNPPYQIVLKLKDLLKYQNDDLIDNLNDCIMSKNEQI